MSGGLPRDKRELFGHVAIIGLAAGTFFFLSDLAHYWGGGLRPNPLWLATASTTSIALLIDKRFRPSAILGGALGCIVAGLILFDESLRSLVTPCLGNTAETIIMVALFPRALTADLSFARTRRAVAWIGLSMFAAFVGAVIATADTSSEVIGERVESLLRWTLGDVVGLLVLPPLVVAFRSPWITPWHDRWHFEAALSGLALSGLLVFTFRTNDPLPYVLIPIVMWMGIRFGPRLAAPATLLAAMGSTFLTSEGQGPFVRFGDDAVVQVQALNVALAVSSLVASSHAIRAWNDQQRLRATLLAMPDVVVTFDRHGGTQGAWGPSPLKAVVGDFVNLTAPASDDPLATGTSAVARGSILEHPDGASIELRSARVDAGMDLYLFRDVTAERTVAEMKEHVAMRAEEVRLRERRALAHDLHDGPVQNVAAALMYLSAAMARDSSDEALLTKAISTMEETQQQLRATLDGFNLQYSDGVLDELTAFGTEILAVVGIDLTVIEPDVDLSKRSGSNDDDHLNEALVLIGREAILNAATHSGASRVEITHEKADGLMTLTIADNGRGIRQDSASKRVKFGLAAMRSRASAVGGTLGVETVIDEGTTIRVSVPIPNTSGRVGGI